jgi:hypothetical protein
MSLRLMAIVLMIFPAAPAVAQSLPATMAAIDLSRLAPNPSVSWLVLNETSERSVIKASWSRQVMPSLADQTTADGERYLQLPLVRVYDSRGRRLKLRSDATDPRVAAYRLNEAIARMEIDTDAVGLQDDIAQLKLEGAAAQLPEATAYVIDYSADWCHTSGPFQEALDDWHRVAAAEGIVVIKAHADFGRTQTVSR